MPDKLLVCRDCGSEFVFTEDEQNFFAEKGFSHEPSRCPECRAARKAARREGEGRQSSFGGREMFPAVCSRCGAETQVPFRPTTGKPVYCSRCYEQVRQSAPRSGGYRSRR
jgi:CxxC-x17-CxxC domain-containing protein